MGRRRDVVQFVEKRLKKKEEEDVRQLNHLIPII